MRKSCLRLFVLFCQLLALAGCATLEVTPQKTLAPATTKQPVNIGVRALGDRMQDIVGARDGSVVKEASGTLFDKVTLLPAETRFQQPAELLGTYGTDYILTLGLGDISVNGDLNPIWFAAFPLLFFKIYTPIVTFEPTVTLDVSLTDARNGKMLIRKQYTESASDHFSPSQPGDKVRQLISRTIGNALVTIMQDSQKSIATARTTGT